MHVAAEPYAYSYVATCTLLHVAKITHGYIENVSLLKSSKRIWKQASTSYAFSPMSVEFFITSVCYIMCLRGSRSTAGHQHKEIDFTLAVSEGRLSLTD